MVRESDAGFRPRDSWAGRLRDQGAQAYQRPRASKRRDHRDTECEVMKTTKQLLNGKFSIGMWEFGSGDPLLFIHGAGGLFGVDPFLEELGKTHKVYAPHFPGYGESTGSEH